MTNRETTNKNLDLAFQVIRQVVAEPKLLAEVDAVSSEGTLVLYDPEDDALSRANDKMAGAMTKRKERNVRVELSRHLHLTPR